MAWQRNYVVLPSGERVRFALLQRDDADAIYVRFSGKDGKRAKKSTGQRRKSDAIGEAHRIILEEYGVVAPTSETVTWAVAQGKLREAMEADGKRPKTIQGYMETLDKLIAMFPLAKGPADVTDRMAGDFKTKYGKGGFTRKRELKQGEKPVLRREARSPWTAASAR